MASGPSQPACSLPWRQGFTECCGSADRDGYSRPFMRLLSLAGQLVLLALGMAWLVPAVLLTGGGPQGIPWWRYAVVCVLVLAVGLAWRQGSRGLALGVLAVLCT